MTSPPTLDEAIALHRAGNLDQAQLAYRAILRGDPKNAGAWNNLGNVLKDSAEIGAAVECCRTALDIEPGNAAIHSSLCYKLHFHPDYTRADFSRELAAWEAAHAEPLRSEIASHGNDRCLTRRLRVGYVSPDFYGHAECFFVLPLLRAHDRANFEIHCYASVRVPDKATELLKLHADRWHDVLGLSDARLAEKIRADGIDILVDLTMHMADNRLLTFARKPAPIQITWLAYPGGTGLKAMDYRITDDHLDPLPEYDLHYAEKSIRLPNAWICYDPLSDIPPAAAGERSHVVFGSLNNPAKLNAATLRLWADVLEKVEDSRLLLLIDSNDQRRRITSHFERQTAIDPNRIGFVPRTSNRRKYLRLHDQIDVCLDPQPYSGITTTCDALWMGVPVVALRGRTACGRAAAGILTNIGHADWVGDDSASYVDIATCLSSDVAATRAHRATLRRQFESSPIGQPGQFARHLEQAYRQVWQDYASGTFRNG